MAMKIGRSKYHHGKAGSDEESDSEKCFTATNWI